MLEKIKLFQVLLDFKQLLLGSDEEQPKRRCLTWAFSLLCNSKNCWSATKIRLEI